MRPTPCCPTRTNARSTTTPAACSARAPADASAPPRGGGGGTTTFDLGDLFGNRGAGAGQGGLGDLLGDIFAGGGGGGGPRRTTVQPRRGADVEAQTTITFRQAVDGVTVPLRMTGDTACPACSGTGARSGTVPTVCPNCHGTGMQTTSDGGVFAMTEPCRECRGRGLVVTDPCPTCHGSGRGASTRTMQVRIPAGVKDGQRIRLRGKGAAGERGGPPGDLYVVVGVSPHPVFGRAADNLTLTAPITFDEATLGAEVKVPDVGCRAGDAEDPAGYAERTHLPGTWPRRHPQGRHQGRPAGDGRGRRARSAQLRCQGRRRGAACAGRRCRPAGRPVQQGRLVSDFEFVREEAPIFVISVAADLTGMHPQTLRGYDRIGLVSPGRTGGGGRRYSWHDIEQLREVARLSAQGIGLEGARKILELHEELAEQRRRCEQLEAALEIAEAALSAGPNLPAVRPQSVVRWRRPTR